MYIVAHKKEPNTASISYLSSSLGVADPLTTSSYTGPFGTARTTRLHIQKDTRFLLDVHRFARQSFSLIVLVCRGYIETKLL